MVKWLTIFIAQQNPHQQKLKNRLRNYWGVEFYFPIQIVKLKCKALSIKGFRGCVFIWATTGQQNPLKQVQVQHKEKKKCCLV